MHCGKSNIDRYPLKKLRDIPSSEATVTTQSEVEKTAEELKAVLEQGAGFDERCAGAAEQGQQVEY